MRSRLNDFQRYSASNRTDASFPARIPTTTEPADTIIVSEFSTGPDYALIVPFGVGNADDVFKLRVIGWRRVSHVGAVTLWLPVPLIEATCTLGARIGVSGAAVTEVERFVDTISIDAGNIDVSVEGVSIADTVAHLLLDVKGFTRLEISFDQVSGTPTMNALYAWL